MKKTYRILTPTEYEALIDVIEKSRLRIVVELMLNSGARYSEVSWISKHLSYFDAKNNAISLPEENTKTEKDRAIHLTPDFSKSFYQYIREHKTIKVPCRETMDRNLKRWYWEIPEFQGMNWYPTVKTFRKTWESWLLAAGYQSMQVALSQGHSELISYGHYANLDPRLKSEMDKVKKLTEGWGT